MRTLGGLRGRTLLDQVRGRESNRNNNGVIDELREGNVEAKEDWRGETEGYIG